MGEEDGSACGESYTGDELDEGFEDVEGCVGEEEGAERGE